jgi:membrane associated rhomboid family serine protease
MGIYDRDYYRDEAPRRSFGNFSTTSVTTWLIVINVVVFILDQMHVQPLFYWGYFSSEMALNHLQLWRFVTYEFLHANGRHVFGNMLGLYFFGPMVEAHWGKPRYIVFYLVCGVAGALSYLLLTALHVLGSTPYSPMIGASACVFGVLIAGATVAPDTTVMLIFPPIPMKLKTMAWLMVGLAAYTVLNSGPNAGGEAAHLGGALLGFVLIRNPQWLSWIKWGTRRRYPREWR